MKPTILQYRSASKGFLWVPISLVLIAIIQLYLLIPQHYELGNKQYYLRFSLYLGSLIVYSTLFGLFFIQKTIVLYEQGIQIGKKSYTYDDILSIKVMPNKVIIRIKQEGYNEFKFKNFSKTNPGEAISIFKELQSDIEESKKSS